MITTTEHPTPLMRYSRLRVLLGQRALFQRILATFAAQGGQVQIRHVELHLLSTVYYGVILTAPSEVLELCVDRLNNLFETT